MSVLVSLGGVAWEESGQYTAELSALADPPPLLWVLCQHRWTLPVSSFSSLCPVLMAKKKRCSSGEHPLPEACVSNLLPSLLFSYVSLLHLGLGSPRATTACSQEVFTELRCHLHWCASSQLEQMEEQEPSATGKRPALLQRYLFHLDNYGKKSHFLPISTPSWVLK